MMIKTWNLKLQVDAHLYWDVGVVPGQHHVPALLPPLHQSHRECKDLAEERQATSCPVHLAVGGHLDDGDWGGMSKGFIY